MTKLKKPKEKKIKAGKPPTPTLADAVPSLIRQLRDLAEFEDRGTGYFMAFFRASGGIREVTPFAAGGDAVTVYLTEVVSPAVRSLAVAGRTAEAQRLIARAGEFAVTASQTLGESSPGAAILATLRDELRSYALHL